VITDRQIAVNKKVMSLNEFKWTKTNQSQEFQQGIILTVWRFLSNNYISINVSMDYVTICAAANCSSYAHQAVFLHFKDKAINSQG
jgi:hypothetical protein